MSAKHADSSRSNDPDVVVTYTRIPRRRGPKWPPGPANAKRASRPFPDGDMFEHAERAEGPEVHIDGLRAPRAANIDDFMEGTRRPDWLRYGVVGASLAVIGGIGIVAVTVGFATVLPGGGSPDGVSSVPAGSLGSFDSPVQRDFASDGIRQIPMPSGPPDATWRVDTPPPIPRPRPDDTVARAEPDIVVPQSTPAQAPVEGGADGQQTLSAAPTVAPTANDNHDGLISSIEETLARVDAAKAAETDAGSSDLAPQSPRAKPLGADETAAPVVTIPPANPPSVELNVPPVGSSADVSPPPAAVQDDESSTTSPVPPEPVPSGGSTYPSGEAFPQGPGIYPSDPYAIPLDPVDGTDARRPGFLRKTLAKATGVVGRLFARNRTWIDGPPS